ncbi:IclR family transcriptional regulator [Paraburkholderia bonniea]|uniref:IclR family transcriptional regulator n=1 Tax=Paraburkholderia bonniea TaxID=2152891 RepID=UPI00129203FF|nr:IclR family transcriptional regulator [Paraburkholderia bonniea]WJF89666.1 IclR family transcriptional regulator [Paraburkholderia bonniea]WJF92980.1 IclR family transcriptional regulator [Paraburkholderia bonniea]
MLKTLDSALALLTRFTIDEPTWGVRELAKATGTHHAVVHRVLATFAANGFLMQDSAGRYALGLRLFELGQVAHQTFVPSAVVQPALDALAEHCGETVFLTLLDGNEGVCTDIGQSQQQLRFSVELGQRFSLLAGAHAKVILAFQSDEFRAAIYQSADIADAATIDGDLARIRADGWSYTREEAAATVAGVALPLRSSDRRRVIGSLGIAGPLQRIEGETVTQLVEILKKTRETIEPVVGLNR